ncbi:hypothetical protein TSMEX_011100 [Taenia solium]
MSSGYHLLAGASVVPKFIALGCGCSLAAFVIGVLRLHLEKIGRHKHSRIAYIALLSSGCYFRLFKAMSMLIALVIWGDTAAHMSTEVIEQRRMGLLRNYFRLLNANIYENRTALVHVVTEHIAAARNHLTDAFLMGAFQSLYLSWPFGVAVTSEIFLFMATVLYLTRKDFKAAPQQFPWVSVAKEQRVPRLGIVGSGKRWVTNCSGTEVRHMPRTGESVTILKRGSENDVCLRQLPQSRGLQAGHLQQK